MNSCGSFSLLCGLMLVLHSPIPAVSVGSTLHLKDIVLGRCWEYQMNKQLNINCTEIWTAFHGSFAYKDPCRLTFADYGLFFDAVQGKDITDKALFWSGTYKAVHSYSDFDLRFTTLEDTFEGSIVNGLRWCGNSSLPRSTTDGIDYQSCPDCDIITAFWGLASKRFAERARGVVRVMVNGTRKGPQGKPIPAYNRSSFFGRYELPSFNVSTITRLEVIVVHTINEEELETCGSGTINMLQADAKSRGLQVTCTDDPDSVKHILCTDYPLSKECLFLAGNTPMRRKDSIRFWKSVNIGISLAAAVLFIVTIAIATAWCKKRLKKTEDDTIVLT